MQLFKRFFGQPKVRLEKVAATSTPDDGDRAVLDQLRRLGANLSQPRGTRHYLYFPSVEAAQAAAPRLEADGFAVEMSLGADQKNWLALATHTAVINTDTVPELRARLTALAAAHGGDYDGWEATPTP